jgi:hypothetical protein
MLQRDGRADNGMAVLGRPLRGRRAVPLTGSAPGGLPFSATGHGKPRRSGMVGDPVLALVVRLLVLLVVLALLALIVRRTRRR